jgi:signal transduction histidine kinase
MSRASQMELALLNLLRNATDAMPPGGTITLRTAITEGNSIDGSQCVAVSVTDTGTGMPPVLAARATAAFFTAKPRGQGTGLGLWMVKRFATSCGGKRDIQTAHGRGTTVPLVLPRTERSAEAADGETGT